MPKQVADQDPNTKFTSSELSEKNQILSPKATAAIALEDGTIVFGRGSGATGITVGELCFNTSITGYQEILTDPSYSNQIVMFTFPHVGNVGANDEDNEESSANGQTAARGAIFRAHPTAPANWRAKDDFSAWLESKNIIGISGIDTRALTNRIREGGMQKVAITHAPDGNIDKEALLATAKSWAGVEGADLAKIVSTNENFQSSQTLWDIKDGYSDSSTSSFHVVVVDYGVKKNILRNLAGIGARCTIVPATTSAEDILSLNPDGIVLSNGPGDPAATAVHAAPIIKKLIASNKPILGICIGHQLLALSLGAKTMKMATGHHGGNHPVKDLETGKVEIVSMNHGFTVDPSTLPDGVEQSHISLFDGTNSGLKVVGKPIISVQHHPEASPGPQDSFYLFKRFADMMKE